MTDFIRGLPAPAQVLPTDPRDAAQARRRPGRCSPRSAAPTATSETLGPVAGIYSDMLLHDMGIELRVEHRLLRLDHPAADGAATSKFAVTEQPTPAEWRTAPLWGVADSGPYLHDGRAADARRGDRAPRRRGGRRRRRGSRGLARPTATAIVAFLKTLRAPVGLEALDRRGGD